MLQEYLVDADTQRVTPEHESRFHCKTLPPISLSAYLDRLEKYMQCDPTMFVIACMYIDRIHEAQPWMVLNTSAMYRLLLVGTMVAAKFYEDRVLTNSYYAKVGGIPLAELNALEHLFLRHIHHNLVVDQEEYDSYQTNLFDKFCKHNDETGEAIINCKT
jgi:hypothetical protein